MVPPLKWHGGKHYLARRIVKLMPRHLHYVEPFAGGLAVLLERDPNDRRLWASECSQRGGVSELVNDINAELSNFWMVLQNPSLFAPFRNYLECVPLSHNEFDQAGKPLDPNEDYSTYGGRNVARAIKFYVRARQSLAGRFQGFTSLTRSRTRRGINGNASEWLGAIEGLPAVHARLRPVVVENMDALKLIAREDTPDTLFYLDPPYLHETRTAPDAYGAHEMSDQQHRDLLELLSSIRGKFMLSGYANPLYSAFETRCHWQRRDFEMPNHAAGGASKDRMVESIWMNFLPREGTDAA